MYIRNLFLHRLSANMSAPNEYFMLFNNKIFAVFGLDFRNLIKEGSETIFEIYGIKCPLKKYPKHGRLFLRILLSKDFKEWIIRKENLFLYNVKYLKTTSLTKLPESKLDKGLFKLINRKKLENGMYYLQYVSEFSDKGIKQMISEYLDEVRKYLKIKGVLNGRSKKVK